jgi:hypothetical protein
MQSYARVTVADCEGATARGCSHHAVAALDGITGARVDWADSKDLGTLARHAATWDMRVRYPSPAPGVLAQISGMV